MVLDGGCGAAVGGAARLVGAPRPRAQINDVCWVEDTPPEPMVLVSMTNGDVMAFKVPRPVDPAETPTYEVKREELLDNVWKLDYAAVRMTYAKQFQDKHQILVLAEDRCLKVFDTRSWRWCAAVARAGGGVRRSCALAVVCGGSARWRWCAVVTRAGGGVRRSRALAVVCGGRARWRWCAAVARAQ